MLTVTARVSNSSSRYAMPSMPALVYAALLYKDDKAPANPQHNDFATGTETEDGKLNFSFQKPDDTDEKFTLEIFAFAKAEGEETPQFSRETVLLSGSKTGLSIVGDKIIIENAIPLSSDKPGTVSLKIKVPAGCSLEIDDTANFDCKKDDLSSDTYTIVEKDGESGISAGAYQVKFTVKKKVGESEEIVHIFSEYINVINGFCTDTWWNGEKSSAVKEITQSMISSTVYVRGAGGWYDDPDNKYTVTASDTNSGSFLSPLETIQKAIDKIIAINDGTSAYTIYVDGTLNGTTPGAHLGADGMADFSALYQNLNLTIKALSATATLDGGARFTIKDDGTVTVTNAGIGKRVIYAKPASGALNLTLENIAITGGNASDNGGGIYFSSTGGSLTMNGGEISGNKAAAGGGVYDDIGKFTMTAGTIGGNTASGSGGGIYFTASNTLKISGSATISGNKAKDGGGVYVYAKNPKMSGGTISGNTASENGGGIYVNVTGTFTMKDGTISGNTANGNDAKKGGGGVYVASGAFAMSDGTVNGNTATNGNGAYLAAKGKLNMSGAAQFAESDDVYLYANGSDIPTITVAGALTASSPVATITPSAYTAGRQVLSAGGAPIDDTVCDKFTLTPAPDGMEWKIVPNDDGTAGALGIESVFLNSSSGDDANSGLTASKAVKTLSKAIELFESQNAKKIMVCAKYTLPSDENALLDRMGGGKRNLTLVRYDGSSDVAGRFAETLLTISQGNVTITNVTFDGNKKKVAASGRLLNVNGSSTTVTLGDGATVCNNSNSNQAGSGVYIYAGTFKMVGGKVTGNESTAAVSGYGPGVCINSSAKFEMSGGIISENYARSANTYGGGGVYVGGTFEMSGGEISGNKALNGGGVFVIGTFTMEGGKIMDNTATSKGNGVYKAENATFTHTGGTVQSD